MPKRKYTITSEEDRKRRADQSRKNAAAAQEGLRKWREKVKKALQEMESRDTP